MAHIGEELRFGEVGGVGRRFGVSQGPFRQNFPGDVSRGAAITEEASGFIEERVAADRDDALRLLADPALIDKVAEGFVTI